MSLRRATTVIAPLLVMALAGPAQAQFEATPMAVVRPGGGILVADGVSKVPLQIVLMGRLGGPSIRRARLVASEGRIMNTRVVGPSAVRFDYAPPKRRQGLDEIIDVALTLSDGNTVAEAFTLAVPAPRAPTVEVSADPGDLIAEAPSPVRVQATAYGEGLEGLSLVADGGNLVRDPGDGDAASAVAKGTLEIPDLPIDAPSHFVILAAAADQRGFAVALEDVPATAPVRISVEIPPGQYLEVKGAKNNPPRVRAPADGRTVMEDVEVDLSSPLRVFRRKGRRRKPVSMIIPTGIVATGVAAPIPGQTIADGGVGPTILVAIPPAAFGAPLFWPEIEIEGANLVDTQEVGPRVRALVLERPTEPGTVRVSLDGQEVGAVELSAARGQKVTVEPRPARGDSRGAVTVVVTDGEGNATDLPKPRVRLASGVALDLERLAPGRYRASVPPGTAGEPDSEVEVVAELAPLPKVTGASLEYAAATTRIRLAGPPPVVKAKDAPPKVEAPPPPRRRRTGPTWKLGVGLQGVAGGSLSGMLMFGGALSLDFRLPWVEQRISVRSGLEILRGSKGGGRINFDEDRRLETTTVLGSVLIPIEAGFALVKSDAFELLVTAGATIRIEQAALQIQGDSPGGGSATGVSGRAGLEAALSAGPGALFLTGRVDGIGSDLSAFSTDNVDLSGSLLSFRGDLGYRLWF